MQAAPPIHWSPGRAPVAVVMISLNEAHNMEAVCSNLAGWAEQVFLVDSYSQDDTVGIALRHGVHVVQRRFKGFGDQWNFALAQLPIGASWTMKLDPDERLSEELKTNIVHATRNDASDGLSVNRRLWFMGQPLPITQKLVRVWRTGRCRFSDVTVNEHPIVDGRTIHVTGDLEHYDSPDLDHWLEKQNRYTTAEAVAAFNGAPLSATPTLLGSSFERRMWLKKNFHRMPLRYNAFFLYHWLYQGAWRAGWTGFAWARLRADVMRFIDYKRREMNLTGRPPAARANGPGSPDPRVPQY